MTNTMSNKISDESLSKGIQIESAGKSQARAPTSSAAGLAQFINGTWQQIIATHKPAWAGGVPKADLLKLNSSLIYSRFNPQASIEMMARLWEDNAKTIGPGFTDGDLYLAHFAGPVTARKCAAAGIAPTTAVFSPAAIAANKSILQGKTCADVRAWANRKMASAGGRNWVAVYMAGAKPVVPPPVKTATKVGGTTAAGQAGAQAAAGMPVGYIIAGVVAAIVVAVGGYFVWSYFDRKNRLVAVEPMAVPEAEGA